mgnify:FL=1
MKAAGWRVIYTGATSVVHLGGESAKTAAAITQSGRQISALQVESELLYYRKHYGLAGVLAHAMLVHLGDALLSLKDMLKGRGWAQARSHWGNSRTVRALCGRTRWGLAPTR